MAREETKTEQINARTTEDVLDLIEGLRDAIQNEAGIRPSKSQVIELAIRELAKKKKVDRRSP